MKTEVNRRRKSALERLLKDKAYYEKLRDNLGKSEYRSPEFLWQSFRNSDSEKLARINREIAVLKRRLGIEG